MIMISSKLLLTVINNMEVRRRKSNSAQDSGRRCMSYGAASKWKIIIKRTQKEVRGNREGWNDDNNLILFKFQLMIANKQEIISAALLIADLTDEDVEKRINAVSSLKTIGVALASPRIRSELIPHLKEQITVDDDSRVILAMLKHLGELGEIMGGGLQYTWLFPILQQVMQNEESKIRLQSSQTYLQIIQKCGVQKCQNKIIASLKNILAFDYHEAKQSFASVTSKMLPLFSAPNQQFLLNTYQSFAESQQLCLRKFAAKYSADLAQWLGDFETGILKIVEILFKDKEQSNKIFLIDTIIVLSKFKSPSFLQAYFNLISYQFTWRVRYELISKVQKMAEVLGTAQKFKPFLGYLVKYIYDIEPEIKSITCLKLREIIRYVQPEDIVNKIIPTLKNIPQDSNVYVRNSLAKSLLSFCPVIGKKNTSEFILPKFLQLLKDDEIQVRLTIFENIEEIASVLGIQTLAQTTIPAITELATNSNWRIKVSSIDILFYLIKESGPDFMTQKIIKLVMDFIRDPFNAVRKQGIILLGKIQVQFGAQWFQKNIMPKMMQISKASSYIQRQTFLNAIQTLAPNLSSQYLTKNINPLICSTFAKDSVINVRITVCTVLKILYQQSPKEKQLFRRAIKGLCEDSCVDVRQTANRISKQIV